MTSNSKKNNRKNEVQSDVSDVILNGVLSIVNKSSGGTWIGTMTDLSAALVRNVGKSNARNLPGSPSALRISLNRVINRLRNRKVSVRFNRSSDHTRTRYVKFVTR